MKERRRLWFRFFLLAALIGALAVAYFQVKDSSWFVMLRDPAYLRHEVEQLGWQGPLMLIALMMLAIVFSPLPSAPIAMAAGMAYGHSWGTLYVVIGAEIGALIAFGLTRWLGGERIRRWFGEKLSVGLFGSQMRLMATVFLLRLLPFVSFDVVSYAAGLTPMTWWRFALATLAGVAPISFLLAHFGESLPAGEIETMALAILLLGVLTLASVFYARRKAKRAQASDSSPPKT